MVAPARRSAVVQDLVLRDDSDRLEIIGGELVPRASPSPSHSFAGIKLGVMVDPFNRKPGHRGPGGWWILPEIHVGYPSGEIFCHDVAGWRRDRIAQRPTEWPVRVRPDWVCEIISPKHEKRDVVDKPRVLHAGEVPHYWTINPEERVLLVHRWSRDGYVIIQRATAGDTLRAEPFEAVELRVGALFDDDDDA